MWNNPLKTCTKQAKFFHDTLDKFNATTLSESQANQIQNAADDYVTG